MGRSIIKVWYDSEGDFLEVLFEKKEGYFRATDDDRVMEKVDSKGNVIGFSVLGARNLAKIPLEVALS